MIRTASAFALAALVGLITILKAEAQRRSSSAGRGAVVGGLTGATIGGLAGAADEVPRSPPQPDLASAQ